MPIQNAKVEIYKDSTLIETGYTDVYGKYHTTLSAGTYRIVISKTGYETIEKTETVTKTTELMVNLPTPAYGLPYDVPLTMPSIIAQFTLSSTDVTLSMITLNYESEVT